MAIDKNSNAFTFLFAAGMVVVFGTLLAMASEGLKPMQKENQKQKKMQDILASMGIPCERTEAPDLFEQYNKQRAVLSSTGEVLSTTEGGIDAQNMEDAFNVDVKKEYRSFRGEEAGKRRYPIYTFEKEGKSFYVVPMVGKGLWGPIWGFVALTSDLNTVFGATFDHKTETPGLGAEIRTKLFQDQFPGEQIFDEQGKFVSIEVVKGTSDAANKHAVDGITGGTITSKGVDEMIRRTLTVYQPYFQSQKSLSSL